ncbi:MAG: peroxiredoxin [Paracoccaceae bacterium]
MSLHSPCPAFNLHVTPGETLSNAALLGAPFVLFLYPRDNTSTCTAEALAFAAALPAFTARNCRVIGCSADSIASHQKFQTKHGFDLPLLSDPEHTLIKPLGCWVQKKLYGREYMGIERSTFLFDAQGKLQAEWRNLRVSGHVEAVLAAI